MRAPLKARTSVMIFWDYDTQWGADRSRSPGGTKNWGPLEFPNTDRLLEIHANYQITACFGVVGAAAMVGDRPYHDPAQIRRIHAAGHEVASHSHRHEWLPALGSEALQETLVSSKDAIEQCIGAPVLAFVPPYNQPFDYSARLSISLSERFKSGRNRTDLLTLCRALRATGYQFCRVGYRTGWHRLMEWALQRPLLRPSEAEQIASMLCVRVGVCGFSVHAHSMLDVCLSRGGLCVVYGHPHSLTADNPQNERYLKPFLQRISTLERDGMIDVVLPNHLLRNNPGS